MTDDTNNWLSDSKPENWLLEEYKLQLAQYFHEDTQFKNVIKMFMTVQLALFAFITSNLVGSKPFTPFAIATVGILLSIAWFGSMVRVREFRNFFEDRITEIEKVLHEAWQHDGFTPLDLRSSNRWDIAKEGECRIYSYFRRVAAAKIYLVLPFCSLVGWIALAGWHVFCIVSAEAGS